MPYTTNDTEEATEKTTEDSEETTADTSEDAVDKEYYGKQDVSKKKTFKRLKLLTEVNKYVASAKKLVVSVVKITKNPHPVIIANEVLAHANNYVSKQASTYVVGNKGWKYILGIPDHFAHNLFKMLCEKGEVETIVLTGKHKTTVKLVSVYGIDFRYIHRDKELMYSVGHTVDQVLAVLGRVIVEKVGPRFQYIRQIELTGRKGNGMHRVIPLVPDRILPSNKGDQLISRLRPFIKEGVNRSVFLVGVPGTGKTCMTEYMSEKLGGTCLTFEAKDLFQMNITQMKFLLKMLRPDTMIVNDIDRAMNTTTAGVLATLETISALTTLMVVTANSSQLPAAALRPGRFDEVIHIQGLGEDTVRAMLKGFPEEVIAQVKDWPAAFISELVERVHVLGFKTLNKELTDLKLRVAYNSQPETRK